MRRTLHIAIASLMLTVMLSASFTAVGQSRGRSWKRGNLSLDLFGERPFDGQTQSHLGYDIVYTTDGSEEGLNSYFYCRTAAVMYPSESWMAAGKASERELEYNQVVFDLVEVYRRQMQREASLFNKRPQYDHLRMTTLQQLEREIRVIDAATEHGADSVALERIRQTNRRWLAENPGTRPDFSPTPRWWSFEAEMGILATFGGVGNEITPSFGAMDFQYTTGWSRHNFHMHLLTGSLSLRREYAAEEYMHLRALQRLDIGMGYGFTILDREAFALTPYIDLGYTLIDGAWYYYVFDHPTYTLGVKGKYYFHHWHTVSNGLRGKARRTTAAASGRLFAGITPGNRGEQAMFTIGLQVGLHIGSLREIVEWK